MTENRGGQRRTEEKESIRELMKKKKTKEWERGKREEGERGETEIETLGGGERERVKGESWSS